MRDSRQSRMGSVMQRTAEGQAPSAGADEGRKGLLPSLRSGRDSADGGRPDGPRSSRGEAGSVPWTASRGLQLLGQPSSSSATYSGYSGDISVTAVEPGSLPTP
jgi:hypothetical protein